MKISLWSVLLCAATALSLPGAAVTADDDVKKDVPQANGGVPEVLPPSEGLDGGEGGHWGIKNDADWQDARWDQMDIGPVFHSSLGTPNGLIVRALSVRLGEQQQVSVAYDTQKAAMRVAWSDAFIAFNPGRFGLIGTPRIGGDVTFVGAAAGWGSAAVAHKGFRLKENRVVVAYTVDETPVRESPWVEQVGDAFAVTRTLEIGPGDKPLRLVVTEGRGAAEVKGAAGRRIATATQGDRITGVAMVAARGAQLRADNAAIVLIIPPRRQTTRIKLLNWSGDGRDVGLFENLARRSAPPQPLDALPQNDQVRWPHALTTQGQRSTQDTAFAIDTITVPYDNPYNALMFLGGHDFFSNGDAAVCTLHGDVWIVTGIDDMLEKITWKRYATGLYQPLGLKIVNDEVYVLCRDQIVRLHDTDANGEADHYECFSDVIQTSPNGHDYVTCLETDAEGNFYYADPKGVHRVSPDGRTHHTIATGFRNPNGISVGPDGVVTVAPQEGEWTPASMIHQVREGGYYGFGGPRVTADRPLGYDQPLLYIPRLIDNSTGGQVWVTSDAWAPLKGQLLNLSFGMSSMQLVLRETVNGEPQGTIVPMPGRFLSGVHRGRFSPHDGQLYVTGTQGWVTNAVRDGCFQRVRYTGKPIHLPVAFNTHTNGISMRFDVALDPEVATDPQSYAIEQWNYKYAATYGSKEYSARHPNVEGHDPVSVSAAYLSQDGKTLFLQIPDIAPVHQLEIKATLQTREGALMPLHTAGTIHNVGPALDISTFHRSEPIEEVEQGIGDASGLVLTIESRVGSQRDMRVSRLAALTVPQGAAPSAFVPAGAFNATWRGNLDLANRSLLTFSAAGRGSLKLIIDDQVVLEGSGDDFSKINEAQIRLPAGKRRLEMHYASPERGDAFVRLYWSAPEFARETVPAGAFTHDPNDPQLAARKQMRRGRELIATMQCIKCHTPSDAFALNEATVMPELLADAPDLTNLGDRLRAGWVAEWIVNPKALRPTARMPGLLGHSDAAEAIKANDTRAWDIAAYLASLTTQAAGANQRDFADAALVNKGGELFARLGCFSCHGLPEATLSEGDDRVPLRDVGRKWKPAALVQFLKAPHDHYKWSRMPNFKFNDDEATQLAAFLLEGATNEPLVANPPMGEPARGKQLVQTLGCINCHNIDRNLPNQFRAKPWQALAQADWLRAGCVADEHVGGQAPNLGLTTDERQAVRAMQPELDALNRRIPAEFATRQFQQLGCMNCHDRDGVASRWSSVESEVAHLLPKKDQPDDGYYFAEEGEAEEISLQSRPALTLTGDQLHTDWLSDFLAGELPYTLRPWLDARMPAFPTHAALLAEGITHQHGQLTHRQDKDAARNDASAIAIGKRLIGTDGFSCNSCHSVASEAAQMQLHFGVINLAHARQRLRLEFYHRWLLNPQRIDPLTPMPAYADREGHTVLNTVLDGDAHRQFDAVWEYLHTVEPQE